MFISFIVTLVVSAICAVFLGALLSPTLNTLGIGGAYPYTAAVILAAIFASISGCQIPQSYSYRVS